MHITTIAIPLSALLLTACAPMAARYSQDALPATV